VKKYGTARQTHCRVKKDGALHAGLTEAKMYTLLITNTNYFTINSV